MPSETIAIVLAPSRSGVKLPSGTSPQLITLRKKVDAAMALAADVMYHGAWSRDLFIAARDQAVSWSWKCDTQEPGYVELMEALSIAEKQAALNRAIVDRRNADDRRRSYYMGSFIDTRAPGANAAMRAFGEADSEVSQLREELEARLAAFSRMPAVFSSPKSRKSSKSSNPVSKSDQGPLPEELDQLREYLTAPQSVKGLELLNVAAPFLNLEKRYEIVSNAIDSGRAEGDALASLIDYTESEDEDTFFDIVSEYGDAAMAIMGAGGSGIVGDLVGAMSMAGEDQYAPSWVFLGYYSINPSDWLVHCTGYGRHVEEHGFLHGVDDVSKLGLTVHLPEHEKDSPGFGFAYTVSDFDKYGFARHGECRYGGDVVLFRAPYISVWHYTDEEKQAIFWGPSASNFILLDHARRGDLRVTIDDEVLEADDMEELVSMIEKHQSKRESMLKSSHRSARRRIIKELRR